MNRSARIVARIFFVACVLQSVIAQAHAFLDHADPKAGSEIDASPDKMRLWFTEEIEAKGSSIAVRDSEGKQVDAGDSHVDASDQSLLIVSLAKLPPGEYTVAWSAVCLAGHHTHGEFKFSIRR